MNHLVLLKDLQQAGVQGSALKLMESYLTNRVQTTCIGQYYSDSQLIEQGVPQGYILGPLLFNLYINHLFDENLNGTLQLYADDALVLYKSKN